jgi:diguanylate cyclase (GGDEF)-like protein/PAS domain S-box-containing protein
MSEVDSLPPNENQRLARLHALKMLDTEPEEIFDSLVYAAAGLCEVPIATISVLDEHRQWFKAVIGLDYRETPRSQAMSVHVVRSGEAMVVPDMTKDPRCAANPLVIGDPHVRFYAAAPITLSDGHTIGALCVLDTAPRDLHDHQVRTLCHLATTAARAFESCERAANALALADETNDRITALYRSSPIPLFSMNGEGRLMMVSDAWTTETGYTREEIEGHHVTDFLTHESRKFAIEVGIPTFLQVGRTHKNEYQMVCKDGSLIDVSVSQVLERDATGAPLRSMGVFVNITPRRRAERALREEQDRLARIVESTNAGTWELNVETGETRYNERWADMIGYTLAELGDTHLDDWLARIHPEDVERARELAAAHYEGRADYFDFEGRIRHRDGRWLWVKDRGRVSARTADGKALRMHGTHADISARKRFEDELARSRELLQVTLESIGDAVITTDTHACIQWMNRVAERMTGWKKQEVLGRPIDRVFVVIDDESRMPTRNPVARCLATSQIVGGSGNTTLISRSGQEFGVEDSASPIREANGQVHGAVLVFRDVSEQRRLNNEMRHRARHDLLTGLFNRAEFESRLGEVLEEAADEVAAHVLLYVDLDQFKLVNDACGHAAGDQLLRQVAAILRECVRGHDTLARLGGDEFGVILEHCDPRSAERVAQKICDAMEEFRFLHDGKRFRVGTSIGLVPIDGRWSNLKALLQAGDASCYAAKEGGRNRVHAWFDSDAALTARNGDMQWVSRLELALDEDRFVLFGQRIESIGEAHDDLHFEVLLRMRDPDGTLIPPGAFLPAAERFHLATRLDRWVVRHALEAMRKATRDRVGVGMMSINLSGHSLGDRAFHRDISDMIRRAPFDVSRICFEITETAAITHMADARAFIDDVRALGVKIALDDFGAGASSFGYLKSLPVDYLKIDGHFITNLLEDELDHAAVRCFCEVARVVGVKTIAEFVENDAVRQELRAIGVDMAQGYLVHRPEPLERLLVATPAANTSNFANAAFATS